MTHIRALLALSFVALALAACAADPPPTLEEQIYHSFPYDLNAA